MDVIPIKWRHSPWPFAIAYLLLIPAFAILYAAFPGEFFHATVQYEPYLQEDEHRILEELRQAMSDNYSRFAGSTTLPTGAQISWENVQLFDLRPEGTYQYSFA